MRESKFFSSPLHAVARTQATSFNCIVNEPVGVDCSGVKVACESFVLISQLLSHASNSHSTDERSNS